MSVRIPPQIAEFVQQHQRDVIEIRRVGSRETCDPPPVGTDEDWLILLSPRPHRNVRQHAEAWFSARGWAVGGSQDEGASSRFVSLTSGDLNVLLTVDVEFFAGFMIGTSICKRLNLLDKADRIAVVRACRERSECEQRSADSFGDMLS